MFIICIPNEIERVKHFQQNIQAQDFA